ncbi:MAG: rhomboid family intramembrane serine protease GlpG [Pseudomonadales bacterium]|nr:rhomboid family intramembrane serine protease GlpG [Pseudomonadales bacterium]
MQHLTFIRHPRYAQAFVDYLKSLGLSASIQIRDDGANIFIEQDEELPTALEELQRFLNEPNHERYRQASWLVAEDNAQQAEKLSGVYRGMTFARIMKLSGVVSKTVIVICLVVYILTSQGMDAVARSPFMFFNSFEALLDSGDLWRWITPAFIHFGIFHFLFNMSAWWVFGGMVERTQSSRRLFALFFLCAVVSNLVQFMWTGNGFGGLSGVVYGVLGYLWFYERFSPAPPFRLPKGLMVFMLIALALGFTNIMPMANQAHLSGLLTGCFLGGLFARLDRSGAG